MKTDNIQISPYYKLEAISFKHYQYQQWTPKLGNYFTICRNDEELFKVVDINETHFYYVLCNGLEQEPDKWDLLLSEFGEHLVHVPEFIIEEMFKVNKKNEESGIITLKCPERNNCNCENYKCALLHADDASFQ